MTEFIVWDTEYTCWEDSHETNWNNETDPKEIVQIGAIKIVDGEKVDEMNIYIKPTITNTLSDYFTDLTGITNEKVQKYGLDFELAMKNLYAFVKNCDHVYSYGNDIDIVMENLKLHNISKKSKYYEKLFLNKFKDFKILLANSNIDTGNYSSGELYKAFQLECPYKLKLHNAFHDCYSLFLEFKTFNLN